MRAGPYTFIRRSTLSILLRALECITWCCCQSQFTFAHVVLAPSTMYGSKGAVFAHGATGDAFEASSSVRCSQDFSAPYIFCRFQQSVRTLGIPFEPLVGSIRFSNWCKFETVFATQFVLRTGPDSFGGYETIILNFSTLWNRCVGS